MSAAPRKRSTRSASRAAHPSAQDDPVYFAGRTLLLNGEKIKPGEPVPGAHAWPRLESWLRAGYLKEAS